MILGGLRYERANEETKASVKKMVAEYKHMKCIIATTVDLQPESEKLLKMCGFKRTRRRFENHAHHHVREKLCVWFAHPSEILAS